MMKILKYSFAFILTIVILKGYSKIDKIEQKPNIILIYIDDLGYSDIGCYGQKFGNDFIETPNIDKLAQDGIKFTNAYASAPLCSPSRAALLTGKSPARLGFEFVTKYEKDTFSWDSEVWIKKFEEKKLIPPPYTLNLPLEEITLAEMLKQNGYYTGIVGKWHVSSHHQHYKGWNLTHGPIQQGFDWAKETFGAHPYGYSKNDHVPKHNNWEYPPDELTEKAVGFINQNHEKPFFLFVSHYYVHTPLDNRLKWLIDKYKQKATNGNIKNESQIKYAAFVETMDHYVGRLLKAIDQKGLSDNTLIIFTSDNGGHPEFAFNRPFRGSKWNLYEGGIRIPLIIRWPNRIKKGIECSVPVIQTDLMPTFHELSEGIKRDKYEHWDGTSILSVLKNPKDNLNKNRSFIWHFPYYHPEGESYFIAQDKIGIEDGYTSRTVPHSSILKGKYKLIYFYENDVIELYNLEEDSSESNNLREIQPEKVLALKTELFTYLYKVQARLPRRNDSIK